MAVGTVVFGESVGVLGAICEPWVQMAVWNRSSPYQPGELAGSIDFQCDGLWMAPSGEAPEWLIDDVQLLGDLFSTLTGEPVWRAECETVTTRSCPAFHQDADRLRIITTYSGPATEWAFAGDLNAVGGLGGQAAARPLFPGQVIALKGRGFEGAEAPGIVLHRSPRASRRTPRIFCAVREAAAPWPGNGPLPAADVA